MLEMDVAQDLKARLTKSMPDYVWQVFVGRSVFRMPRAACAAFCVRVNAPVALLTRHARASSPRSNFGAYVTAEDGKYIYFYINQVGFCVYAA